MIFIYQNPNDFTDIQSAKRNQKLLIAGRIYSFEELINNRILIKRDGRTTRISGLFFYKQPTGNFPNKHLYEKYKPRLQFDTVNGGITYDWQATLRDFPLIEGRLMQAYKTFSITNTVEHELGDFEYIDFIYKITDIHKNIFEFGEVKFLKNATVNKHSIIRMGDLVDLGLRVDIVSNKAMMYFNSDTIVNMKFEIWKKNRF